MNYTFWLSIDPQGGDFTNFLKRLDLILQKLYNNKYSIIICGDVNTNYVTDNNRRSQPDAVLHSYNLACIVEFPTRYDLISQTAIDNVCMYVCPLFSVNLSQDMEIVMLLTVRNTAIE